MKGINCWEYKKCGRGMDEPEKHKEGVCPVAKETRLDGLHGGTNAGRACWVIAGTSCDNDFQGSFSQKVFDCLECNFYQIVMREEHSDFHHPGSILEMLIKKPS
jgi:hypothetical protein